VSRSPPPPRGSTNPRTNEDGESVVDGKCPRCRKLKPLRLVADPWLAEVRDVVELGWWCEECYRERVGDI